MGRSKSWINPTSQSCQANCAGVGFGTTVWSEAAGDPIDLYNPELTNTKPIPPGTYDLFAGEQGRATDGRRNCKTSSAWRNTRRSRPSGDGRPRDESPSALFS